MARRPGSRNDLIIGMTLAEVFLLLLIVAWYGSKLESSPQGPGDPLQEVREELARTQEELANTKEDLKKEVAKNKEFEAVLNFLAGYIEYKGPTASQGGWQEAMKAFERNLKRGKPMCDAGNNLLVEAQVTEGTERLIVKTVFEKWKPGQVISEAGMGEFLGRVATVSSSAQAPCAYDYFLSWQTDRDFRVGKLKFEKFFYPAGQAQIR